MSQSANHLTWTWGGNLKSITDEGILEGDAIVFGSEKSPDASSFKDFFTDGTYVHPEDEFTTPLCMEHGFSYRKPIGKAIVTRKENGWVAIAKLNMNDPVVKSRFPEIKAGGWGFSTGAVGHVVEREAKENGTHFISQWMVGELSITRTPAEPKALIHTVKSLDEYYQAFDDSATGTEEENSTMDEKMMKIIEMLVAELVKKHLEAEFTNKHVEGILIPQLEEIKTQLAELKSASLPIGSDEINEKLTVLKSDNEELKATLEKLQSSFNEKEALLPEEVALLSEAQEETEEIEEVENKSQEVISLEEELTQAKQDNEKLKEDLDKAKKINLSLGKTNFNK